MNGDEIVVVTQAPSIGKEIAKSFALSTATSVGVLAGFVVVGFAVSKAQEIINARKSHKTTTENEQV